jgi:hypothetical protein
VVGAPRIRRATAVFSCQKRAASACVGHCLRMGLLDRLRRKTVVVADAEPEASDDALRLEELVPQGGSWKGLLFDNPNIGLAPGLTWTFEFRFAEVSRDYGDSPLSFTVDWAPLPGATWSAMAGQATSCDVFGEPVECSAYFFEHYRFDSIELRVLEQDGNRLRVAVEGHGDVDALGVPMWRGDQWLDFEGIYVQLDGIETVDQAAAQLANFTDISGLTGSMSGHNFKFVEPRS